LFSINISLSHLTAHTDERGGAGLLAVFLFNGIIGEESS
jgi:hypothetical protein